ncbi:Uncharacterised protein [Lysinibacillus sphaericus]|nr:Uncharacterised protein [Lysinibacillus sphaericus]
MITENSSVYFEENDMNFLLRTLQQFVCSKESNGAYEMLKEIDL